MPQSDHGHGCEGFIVTIMAWTVRRALPMLIIALVVTVVAGVFRGSVLFLPGIVGMLAGGVLGYAFGRFARGDPEHVWTLSSRTGFTVGATLVYVVGSVAVVAAVGAGAVAYPIDWFFDVLNGTQGELFYGFSTNSLQSTGGVLNGVWWVVFMVVDGALFAFLHLILMGVALTPDEQLPEQSEGEFRAALPLEPSSTPPWGFLALCLFVAGAVAMSFGAAAWPDLAVLAGAEAPLHVSVAELQGEWLLEPEAMWFADTELARHFTLSFGLGDEIACYSAEEARYMFVLSPRRDGSYEGRLLLPGRGELPVIMRVAPDRAQLRFTVRGLNRAGQVVEREFIAVRSD